MTDTTIGKKYYKFELNMGLMNILAFVIIIVAMIILPLINVDTSVTISSPAIILLMFTGMFAYFGLHELCHGFGYSIFAKNKKNIKYGVALEKGVFYAMCQEKISKKGIMVSLFMPILILTIPVLPLGILLNNGYLVLLSILNLSGAIGDISMMLFIRKMPDLEYIDYDASIGMTLLSNSDLSKYKSTAFKLIKSGELDENKIDKSIKRFSITKPSIIIIAVLFGIQILMSIVDIFL